MLKVECESCKAPYQIDERRVPSSGLKMRCPKCGHSFVVKHPSAASEAPSPPSVASGGGTLLGQAPAPPARAAPQRPVPAAPPPPPTPAVQPGPPTARPPARQPLPSIPAALGGGSDLDLPALPSDLPAARPQGPPIVRRAGGGPSIAPRVVKASNIPPAPAVPAAPRAPVVARPAPPPVAAKKPDFDLDLPVLAGVDDLPALPDVDLPALAGQDLPVPRAPSMPVARPNVVPARNPGARAPSNLPAAMELDLPSPIDADLPARMDVGLPSPANVGLPASATVGLPSPQQTLPSARARGVAAAAAGRLGGGGGGGSKGGGFGGGGFGEIDLPVPQQNLPSLASALPTVANALPSVSNALPTVANALPSVSSSLPVPQNALPSAAQDRSLASAAAVVPAFGPDDFGELELPRAPPMGAASASPDYGAPQGESGSPFDDDPFTPGPPAAAPRGDAGFGELELPEPPHEHRAPSPPSRAPEGRGAVGGMTFGELDLGGGMGDGPGAEVDAAGGDTPFGEASLGSVIQPPPSAPPGAYDAPRVSPVGGIHESLNPGAEATLDPGTRAPRSRERPESKPRRPSALPKIFAVLFGVIVIGGISLSALPAYGPFGWSFIQDTIHKPEYEKAASDAVGAMHAGLGGDSFGDARAACDDLARRHAAMPRAMGLAAVAAIAELETELRFGKDPERAGRVKVWINHDVLAVARGPVRYLDVAQAGVLALDGEKDRGRSALDAAAARYGGDPILQDVLFMRGELEGRLRDAAAMTAAYTKALAVAPGARAHFGLARAAFLGQDFPGAKKELDATLAAAPSFGDALLLRAQLAWAQSHDDDSGDAALKDLALLLDGPAKAKLADTNAADALALRGQIQFARGRTAEARAAFDAALKKDARNGGALVGQANVYYQEQRYAEAATRFDTALQGDPGNVAAIIGEAKAKIGLEKLAEAKTQLADAVKKFPKRAEPLRWLAYVESQLGDKVQAEKDFATSTTLVDPKDPEAIDPYAAFAEFLNAQGRPDDAAAQLAGAQKKLPDSAPLERALGDVAVAQGRFDDAIAHYQSAIQRDPKDASSRFKLGQALRKANKPADATKAFDDVAALDASYPGLALERGLLLFSGGDMQKALDQFKDALAKSPNDPDLQLRVGEAYVQVNQPDDALPMLKKVIEVRPNSAEAEHFFGRALMEQGPVHYPEAMRHLVAARDHDPNQADYHLYVGWLANLLTPPDLGNARKEIGKALDLDQSLADGWWQRGVLEYSTGAFVDSVKDLKHALELKPTRFEVHATLAQDFEQMNMVGQAIAEWRTAFAGDDKNEYWSFRFGKLLYDQGMMAEAAKLLDSAAETAEKDQPRPAWLKLAEFPAGEALRKVGDKKRAIDRYTFFMTLSDQNDPDRRDASQRLKELGAPYQADR